MKSFSRVLWMFAGLLPALAAATPQAKAPCSELLFTGLTHMQKFYFQNQDETRISIDQLQQYFGTRINDRFYQVLRDTAQNPHWVKLPIRARLSVSQDVTDNTAFLGAVRDSGVMLSFPRGNTVELEIAGSIGTLALFIAMSQHLEFEFIQSITLLTPWCKACAGA